jgi:ribosomal small subunit protein bTHX
LYKSRLDNKINKINMGRGDKKSAKGKRAMGSYGITRPRKKTTSTAPVTEVKAVKEKKAPAKKAAPKKEKATEA